MAGCSRSYYRESFTRSFGGGLACNVDFIRFGTAMSIPACRSASFGPENLISLNRRQPFLNHLFSALRFLISIYLPIQAAGTIQSTEINQIRKGSIANMGLLQRVVKNEAMKKSASFHSTEYASLT